MHKVTGKTGSTAKRDNATPSRPFRTTNHLKSDAERAAYLKALFADGNSRVVIIGPLLEPSRRRY